MRIRKAQYRAVYALSSKYPVKLICKVMEIQRSSYYKWLKSGSNSRDLFLAKEIEGIQTKTKQTYGYRRICIALKRKNIQANHKKVLRIMRKYNLLSVIRRKYLYRTSGVLNKYGNLFNRDFVAQKPNVKWTTDISYIHTKAGRLYLSVIKDCFDKSIISYRYSMNMTVGLVTQTIKDAVKKEQSAGVILHSDQGFQYTSNEYNALTKESGITPSMSRAGTPIDNAPIESFFSTLKSECIYLQKLETVQHAKDLIDEYIDCYNNERLQLESGMTPLEIRKISLAG